MHHALMTGLAGLLLATGGLAAADPKTPTPTPTPTVKTSRTCKYKSGIKAGELQYFGDIDPVPIGSPCEDGGGSSGIVVPDVPPVAPKPVPTSRTCKFNAGTRSGQVQYYPAAKPISIGSPCEDGAGSFGLVVADSPQRVAQAGKTSRTCKFDRGTKAGRSQFFAGATPIALGAACNDGAGSTGIAVADAVAAQPTSRTCSFTTGPRKGETKHFPGAQPLQLGSYCEDGAGSSGVAVADGTPPKKSTAQR